MLVMEMSSKMKKNPSIRFNGFTDTWEQRKLIDVADIFGGGTPSTTISDYWDGEIDWYSPVEIGEQVYVNGSQKKLTELGLKKSSAKVLPVGTVLFTSRAGIGKTAILAKEGATNQGFQSIVPHKNTLDSYFIYSRTDELKRYGEIQGAGSTFVEVSGKQMAKMPILIPILEEQTKIGAFFKKLDDTIALHQRQLDNYKELKKTMLQKVFNQELRFKDDYGNDYPEWEIKSFKDVFISIPSKEHQIKSSSYHEKGKYEVVDQGKEDVVGYSDQTEKLFENVPVIIFGDHTTNLKYRDNPFIVGADGVKLLKSTEQAKYSFYVLEKFNVNQEGYKRHYSMLQEINIPIPSRQEQQRIENLLSSIDNKNRKLIYKIALLMELKKSFMQQMFV